MIIAWPWSNCKHEKEMLCLNWELPMVDGVTNSMDVNEGKPQTHN